jgi:two-component system LytT family sensor kinase
MNENSTDNYVLNKKNSRLPSIPYILRKLYLITYKKFVYYLKRSRMFAAINKKKWLNALWWVLGLLILFTYRNLYSFDGFLSTNIVLVLLDLTSLWGCSLILKKLLIPHLLYKKKLVLFILFFLLMLGVAANLIQGIQWIWYTAIGSLSEQSKKVFPGLMYQIFNSYLVVFLGGLCISVFKLLADQWLAQSRYAELQKEKAQTELSFLKAQINPHFLFNSINSIFAHINKENTMAREMVLTFSDMLRYQLYECNVDTISLDKELTYIRNYVKLQRLRKEEHLKIKFETKGETAGYEIAPLLLIPFIENAFKYVSNHEDKENSIDIFIHKDSSRFTFFCMNTKDRMASRDVTEDGGIGINNVKRRLELLYPACHSLQIKNDDVTFTVKLTIP